MDKTTLFVGAVFMIGMGTMMPDTPPLVAGGFVLVWIWLATVMKED